MIPIILLKWTELDNVLMTQLNNVRLDLHKASYNYLVGNINKKQYTHDQAIAQAKYDVIINMLVSIDRIEPVKVNE